MILLAFNFQRRNKLFFLEGNERKWMKLREKFSASVSGVSLNSGNLFFEAWKIY
jgi:hypothetical protein